MDICLYLLLKIKGERMCLGGRESLRRSHKDPRELTLHCTQVLVFAYEKGMSEEPFR